MASVYDARLPAGGLAWLLEIQGISVRYWSGSRPPALGIGWGGLNYTDHECGIIVGDQTASLDELGGVADYGAVDITLTSKAGRATATDPRAVLCRGSRRGASRWTRLLTTMAKTSTGALSLEVEDDPTSWPTLGGLYVLHVGQECLTATGIALTPNRFTGVERAKLRTTPERHVYDPDRAQVPLVYSNAVTWRTRRAKLKAAPITGKALTTADYITVANGFLDDMPALAPGGLGVTFSLAPLIALVEGTIGTEDVAHLLRGWHYFDGHRASTFAHTQIARKGALVEATISAAMVATVTTAATVGGPQAFYWSENADPALADDQPRRLPLVVDSEQLLFDGILGANIDIDGGAACAVAHDSGSPILNPPLWDVVETTLAAGLYAWPDVLMGEVSQAWSPGQVADAGAVPGAWVDVRVEDGDEGPQLSARHNAEHVAHGCRLEFRSGWDRGRLFSRPDGQGYTRQTHLVCWYGLQACAPDEPNWFDPRTRGAFGESAPARTSWVREVQVEAVAGADSPRDTFPIRGYPLAFYQTGEFHFLADAQIIDPGGTPQHVLITWTEGGEQRRQVTRVVATFAEPDASANTIGYRFNLDETWERRTRAFGDWGQMAEIRPVAAWWKRPAWEVLLSLLNSGVGNTFNGGYDVLPTGVNIDDSDLDLDSFQEYGRLAIEDVWSPVLVGATTPATLIKDILRCMGCALVMRRWPLTGDLRIGLAPVGIETTDAMLTIADGDIAIGGRPTSAWVNKPIARYQVGANYSIDDDKPLVTAPYTDATAMAENGGDAGAELKLELRGYWLDDAGDIVLQVLPVIDSIRARMGSPRRVYSLTVHRGTGLRLALGDVVTLTARDATGYDGGWGVSGVAGRVIAVSVAHREATATLKIASYEANAAGWAPAMQVASVVDADHVVVEDNEFSETTHPLSGAAQLDVDFFQVGDPVELIPPGDWGARVTTTIASISGTTLEITGHTALAGWTIRPRAYDSTNDRLRGYVHGADALRTLGAAGDRAKDWAG